ncbi:2072_t:CDS:2, partial [Entrophospora sp. SA101]
RKGGVKYRRKTFKENIQGITKPAIRRLTRRGGVRRISELVYEETRSVLKMFLENDTVTYTEYARCKTVTSLDQSSQWLNYDASSSSASHQYRNKTSDYPDIEEVARIWVDQLLARDLTLIGWLAKIKNRNNLHSYKKRGGSMSAPIHEIASTSRNLTRMMYGIMMRLHYSGG